MKAHPVLHFIDKETVLKEMEKCSQDQNLKHGWAWTGTSSFDFIFPIMSHLFCLHQEFMFFENKNINLTKISPFFSSFISNVSYIQMEIYSSCLWGLLWSDPPEKHSLFVQAVQSFCLSRHNWMLITSIKLSLITLCEALLFFLSNFLGI